jgi:hypothetical protein
LYRIQSPIKIRNLQIFLKDAFVSLAQLFDLCQRPATSLKQLFNVSPGAKNILLVEPLGEWSIFLFFTIMKRQKLHSDVKIMLQVFGSIKLAAA